MRIRNVEIPDPPRPVARRLSDRHAAPGELGEDGVHIVNREAHRHRSRRPGEPALLVEHETGGRELGHGITYEPHLQTELVPVEGHRPRKLWHWQVHMTQSNHDNPSAGKTRTRFRPQSTHRPYCSQPWG